MGCEPFQFSDKCVNAKKSGNAGRAVCWGFVLCKKSVSDDETHTYAMVTFI